MSYTIVGVIGHIDHGKTSLVAALTGVDTDTHPEEKRRGITIDLGFASYCDGDDRFALIDAPGHQKYIGNLLAGVSAVDVGLLVVACDQGIQAQTLEHAAILHSLGVEKLIVAISRIDLADAATLEELTEELDLFLADYGFHDIPMVAVSSVTGQGMDQLRELLRQHARRTDRVTSSSFRMPIDRVFTIEGRGCVVAGTPWSGEVAVGDHLQLARTGQIVRVRGLEVHGQQVEHSTAGSRTAMNLVGTSAVDIARGDELVTESTHPMAKRLVVQMTLFRDASEIRCPTTVQLHSATMACEAKVTGPKRIEPAQSDIVVVDTDHPIVATYRQQVLFRRPYPVGSFAGGRVLGAVDRAPRQTTRLLKLGQQLVDADPVQRIAAWVDYRGELDVDAQWFELQVGIPESELHQRIEQGIETGRFEMPVPQRLVSTDLLTTIASRVTSLLTHQAESTDDAWMVQQAVFDRLRNNASPQVIAHVIAQLIESKQLVRVGKMVAIASDKTVLSKKQKARMAKIMDMYRDSRTPPTIKEAAAALETNVDTVASLVRFATQQRTLLDLGGGFFISDSAFRQLCRELNDLFVEQPSQSVSTIRDRWGITRKHAIPLLEYCDRQKITVRQGDIRTAGPTLNTMLDEVAPVESR